MKRTAHLFMVLFLLCAGNLKAEVYTIDFNRGTVNGLSINTNVEGAEQSYYCKEGSDLFVLHDRTSKCYYNDKGCGIRIAASNGVGMFILSLPATTPILKVVAYASKVLNNTSSTLAFYAGNAEIKTFNNEELKPYSTENPASTYYQLPDIVVNREFKDLKFQAPKGGYVMLHRIEIFTKDGGIDDDGIKSPAENDDEMGFFYNLSGQRISKLGRGIFIKGGKKYYVR